MNTRCMLFARAAALIVVIAALFLVPTASQAQAVDCGRCDHFTFAVRADVNCPITICYSLSPLSPALCRSVNPGQSVTIPCPSYRVWVLTCSGPYYIIPANADALCSPILKFAADCCGRICNAPSADLCARLEVQPSPCLNAGCP